MIANDIKIARPLYESATLQHTSTLVVFNGMLLSVHLREEIIASVQQSKTPFRILLHDIAVALGRVKDEWCVYKIRAIEAHARELHECLKTNRRTFKPSQSPWACWQRQPWACSWSP
mgnify:CR=1 FL=1